MLLSLLVHSTSVVERSLGMEHNQVIAAKRTGTRKIVDNPTKLDVSKKVARRFPRFPADFRLSVQLFRPAGSMSLWGLCNELGEDGISGTLTGELKLGEVVSMEICVPGIGCTLKLRALVRYC